MQLDQLQADTELGNMSNSIGFEINRNKFITALGHVQSVVERRNTIAILSNVKIDVSSGEITLTSTDMEISVCETIEATTLKNGSLTVNANTLYDIIRKLPDNSMVNVEGDSDNLGKISIKSALCDFSLASLPSKDFPLIESGEMSNNFDISSAQLVSLIDKTKFSVSNEETRYYLNGIYLHTLDNQLIAVATDGHRLAKIAIDAPDNITQMQGVIVPKKTIGEIRRLAEQAESKISISISDKKIKLSFGNVVLVSKLIDGTFPDYTKVIPNANDRSMILNTQDFVKSVDRVSTISSNKTKAIKFFVTKDKLVLKSSSEENGSAQEEIKVQYDNEDLEIGFNARYVLDILAVIDSENVEVLFSEIGAPTLIKDCDDSSVTFVVMPMRI